MSYFIVSLSHVAHIRLVTAKMFHWKHSQTVIALFYYFSMAPSKSFRLLPIVHVHVLSETDQLSKTGHVAWQIY